MTEYAGYDAFASDGFEAYGAPPGGVESGFEGPNLGNAQKRFYVREQDKRPTSTSPGGTGDTAPAAPPVAPEEPPNAARAAGVSMLWAALGAAGGAFFGGWWGAAAGGLAAGAIRNGMRARQQWASQDALQREEATSSATVAVLGAGAASYLAYRAYKHQRLE